MKMTPLFIYLKELILNIEYINKVGILFEIRYLHPLSKGDLAFHFLPLFKSWLICKLNFISPSFLIFNLKKLISCPLRLAHLTLTLPKISFINGSFMVQM